MPSKRFEANESLLGLPVGKKVKICIKITIDLNNILLWVLRLDFLKNCILFFSCRDNRWVRESTGVSKSTGPES